MIIVICKFNFDLMVLLAHKIIQKLDMNFICNIIICLCLILFFNDIVCSIKLYHMLSLSKMFENATFRSDFFLLNYIFIFCRKIL